MQALRLRWARTRNAMIADPGFRARATRWPFGKLVARRYAREMFDLTAGFVYAQITQAIVESGLLDALSARPIDAAEAARVAGLSVPAAEALLKAAESLELTQSLGPVWTLGRRGAALSTSPGVAEMIRHHRLLYADLAEPLAMLRGEGPGRLAALWRYDGSADPEDAGTYSALMAASQPMVADQALAAYDFGRHRALLDIGGGAGAFLSAISRAAPSLRMGLFDLPVVIEAARARLGERAAAVAFHPGSFRTDSLPDGYDLITMVRVLHDHDDDVVAALLANVRAALPPGGRALIVEPLAGTASARRVGHGYFGFYLAAMQSGRPRTFGEYRRMAQTAGFARARLLATPVPLVASVIRLDR